MAKILAKRCEIGDASRGSLSSYAYILMVLHYLQQVNPPVIPVLQEVESLQWSSLNVLPSVICPSVLKEYLWKQIEVPGVDKSKFTTEGWNTWFFEDITKLVLSCSIVIIVLIQLLWMYISISLVQRRLESSVASLRCQSRTTFGAMAGIFALLRRNVRLPASGGDHPPEKTTLPDRKNVDRPAHRHRRSFRLEPQSRLGPFAQK